MPAAINVPGVQNLTASQIDAVNSAAVKLGMDPDWLFTVISFETGGSFSPTVRNAAGSGAFGLIQFMPSTARNLLGTATNDEAVRKGMAMSFNEQLEKMVIPYLRGPKYKSVEDVYLKIFYPVAMGKPDDYVIGSAPGAVYTQNRGFDREGKGYITRRDVTRKIRSIYDNGTGVVSKDYEVGELIAPKAWSLGQFIVGVVVSAAMVWGVYTRTNALEGKFTLRSKPRPLPFDLPI